MESEPSRSPRSATETLVREVLRATAKIGTIFAVVIGVSLWYFAPSCACTTEEYRYTQAMKSDLRSLWSAQEIYYADHETYSASLSELLVTDGYADGAPTEGFRPSPGVTVIVDDVASDGFTAHASHTGTPVQCVIFFGDARPPHPDIPAGEVSCSDPNEPT